MDNLHSGVVLLMSAEDGIADTIRPRLEKMGANLFRIFAPREIFTLDDIGFVTLERHINEYKPELVIIDPLMPFLDSKKDTNKASDMRPFFKNLARLARLYDCAVVVTRHLAKSLEQKGITKGLGSIDISAAVRSMLQVSEESKGLKRVDHIKSNVGAMAKSFGYRLDNGVFTFVGMLDDAESTEYKSQGEVDRACDFIREILKTGPTTSAEAQESCQEMGFSKSTIKRARTRLGVDARKVGLIWYWWLPGYGDAPGTPASRAQGSQECQESLWDPDNDLTEE
jgi:hypothetical protein